MRATAVLLFLIPSWPAAASPGAIIVPGPAESSGYAEVPVGPAPAAPTSMRRPQSPPVVDPPAPEPVAGVGGHDGDVHAPELAPVSVLIAYRAGSFVARERAMAIARSLDAAGVSGIRFTTLRAAPRSALIGFLYEPDATAAAAVARAAGTAFDLPPPVRLDPADAHSLRPGTVEITVDG